MKLNRIKTAYNLYSAYESSGLTQAKIAEAVGIKSAENVSKWLNDKVVPPLERMASLCKILNVKMDDVLVMEDK